MGLTALFGASFDPPHCGHVALVDAARERFAPERVVILVSVQPHHKQVDTPFDARLELARAAFPGCVIEPEESTTDVTVREAEERLGEVIFLIGADQFRDFPTWRDPEAVLEHARLGVATRPGVSRESLQDVLERLSRPERVVFFEIPELPIASRDLRERAARGESLRGLVPEAVADLIEARGLYRP